MNVKQIYIWNDDRTGGLKSKATIDVAGLGDVQFDNALSQQLVETIRAEAEAALRVRLGQTLEQTNATL
jgi:predicted nicotinamide N-methyase